ncbi:MAG: hypothetical protein J7604_06040 [Sporocytophaga sp.]|uniref:hypothetical protein n=1 Tax=Sporocytophaga sp. TaxID=2231183 RepID=UPI001B27189A|nr:hypothetical protein [Sporocytophaga sp.]MBO9699752.1 hypothetical protein [Sporocytophaga sp.]
MKNLKLTFLLLTLLINSKGFSQSKPEKVPRYTQEIHDKKWYQTQADLWEIEVKKDPKSEDSWLNLYTAYRSLWVLNIYSEASNKKVTEVVDRMEKVIPESFTFNLTKGWLMGCWDPASMKYIQKAYQLQPENPATYHELSVRYEVELNYEKRKEFHIKMFEKSDISQGLLNYNYNVLASLEKDAILFTIGDNDTYPAWMIQDVLGFRTDVTIINTSLAGINDYREKLFKKAGILQNTAKTNALQVKEPFTAESREVWEKLLIKSVVENSGSKPVYFALTMGNSESFSGIKDKLYITGLALKYSEEKIDNISFIRKNYEKKFLLDYIKANFQTDKSKNFVNLINQNYIAPFTLLYKHYRTTEEAEKAEEVKQLILKVAKDGNREKEVSEMLK